MNNTSLPLDVMSEIMEWCPPTVTTSLMLSCRLLYDEGPRHLLRNGVTIHSSYQLEFFLLFMLARDSARFKFLRKLEVRLLDVFSSREASKCLTELFKSPSLSLVSLTLRDSEGILWHNKDMLSTITTLQHLSLFHAGIRAYSAVRALPSKLTSLTIASFTGGDVFWSPNSFMDEYNELRGMPLTITTLLVNTRHAMPPWREGGHAFPHVRTFGLVFHYHSLQDIEIQTLAHTFPNIVHLQLIPGQMPIEPSYPYPYEIETIEELRSGNRGRQSHQPRFWPDLAECSGPLFMVYALGFMGSIPKLRLWKLLASTSFMPMLRAVLADSRPASLEFGVLGLPVLEAALQVLRDEDLPTLRELTVHVTLRVQHHMSSQLEDACLLFIPLPRDLAALHIVLSYETFSTNVSHPNTNDLGSITHRISASSSSLKNMTIRLSEGCGPAWPSLEYDYEERETGLLSL